MNKKENIQQNLSASIVISKKAFITSASIIFALLIVAGILTLVIPTGRYQRVVENGIETVKPGSFTFTSEKRLPIYRWFTAPVEVLFAPGNINVITIILFILIIGSSFAVLDKTNVLQYIIFMLTQRFNKKKNTLFAILILFFMLLGSLFGIFEEMIPLVPLILLLSMNMGYDKYLGLFLSLLATGFGFSSAISNPFTIGVAQKIANLPVFSGFELRMVVFIVIYTVLLLFVINYAKKYSKNLNKNADTGSLKNGLSDTFPNYANANTVELNRLSKEQRLDEDFAKNLQDKKIKRSIKFFFITISFMFAFIILTLFVKGLSNMSLPFIALIFIFLAIGTSALMKIPAKDVLKYLKNGIVGIAPAALLICLAMGVNHIIKNGGVLDTILYYAANIMTKSSNIVSALIIYYITLIMNFFIGSASAKAFLLLPILTPLADLSSVTRQVAVLAFQFGDGFSNVLYPTNPVLLIALAISGVSYTSWLKKTFLVQIIVFVITSIFIVLAVLIGYGPY